MAAAAADRVVGGDRGPRPSVLKKRFTFPDFAAALAVSLTLDGVANSFCSDSIRSRRWRWSTDRR